MKTEMEVLERLESLIPRGLIEHLRDEKIKADITEKNVKIDFPDIDNMRKDNMLYIVPEYENIEELTVSSDRAEFEVKVFIISKKGNSESLVKRVFDLYTAFYLFMRSDPTLNGFIDWSRITDMDYYPALTASSTMVAIEVTLTLSWAKTF